MHALAPNKTSIFDNDTWRGRCYWERARGGEPGQTRLRTPKGTWIGNGRGLGTTKGIRRTRTGQELEAGGVCVSSHVGSEESQHQWWMGPKRDGERGIA